MSASPVIGSPRRPGRLLLLPIAVAVLGVVVAIVYQNLSMIRASRTMVIHRTSTLASLLETEVANIAHFGQFRVERLDEVFSDLVEQGVVEHIRLVSTHGTVLVEAGEAAKTPVPPAGESAPIIAGEHIFVSRKIVIQESFASAHGGSWAGASPGGPAGNPSGLITGEVTLEMTCDGHWLSEIRSDTAVNLGVTLGLLVAFAVSVALMMRANRASELAKRRTLLAEQRSQHLAGINLMASGLAHEIKNPVGAVRGFTQLLAGGSPEGSEEHRHLQIMMESLDEVNERIDRLLSFAVPRPISRRPQSLPALVRDVLRLMGPDISIKEVNLETGFDDDAPPADIDERQIREVVLNLLINALDAVGVGGTIRVETRYESDEERHLLVVTDNGDGIAAENLEKVFHPYFTTKARGSGLGLAICRRNVENHGGSIWMVSDVRRGTTAVVSIPARQDA